jgi:hypothetical protein
MVGVAKCCMLLCSRRLSVCHTSPTSVGLVHVSLIHITLQHMITLDVRSAHAVLTPTASTNWLQQLARQAGAEENAKLSLCTELGRIVEWSRAPLIRGLN